VQTEEGGFLAERAGTGRGHREAVGVEVVLERKDLWALVAEVVVVK
jgi:hypothetical protein